MPKKKKKVFVGMSGGVDSSVAAALLKNAGFDTVGVHMKCWSREFSEECTATDDERAARVAAAHLGIPFYVWNFIAEYKRRVVDYFIEGYRQGITPNPDIMCNKEIKFGLFFEKAMRLGADYIATGHYARIRREIPNPKSQIPNKSKSSNSKEQNARILQAIDKNKDQSYFLAFVQPEVLDKVLFPIGEYTKPQVRKLARKFGLPNAERKDSQGICFMGKVEVGDFLRRYIRPERGQIADKEGNILGEHDGAYFYTVGQRKGLGVARGPWYVAGKNLASNTLVVSKAESDIVSAKANVRGARWFSSEEPKDFDMEVKLRYRQESVPVRLAPKGKKGSYDLFFQTPQRAITPGQFAAFYRGEELVGAGVLAG